ncbi:uncharacterized protein LOC115449193 [Manduca sexta]|uniref:uncharacterized protein LOC115449193 n=1 Tax=Manduca sexta TaxID=7130 RepID=UPI00188F26A4|nr:uncharacterized protein LOC115449193 [Manduca sexta]
MKLVAYLMLFSVASGLSENEALSTPATGTLSPHGNQVTNTSCEANLPQTTEELLDKLLVLVQDIVENGQEHLGLPPLDPMKVDDYILVIPAGLIFLYLKLKGISAYGFGDFVIHESKLDIDNLTFDIDVEFPSLHIISDEYNLVGYLYTLIPLYGNGRAEFHIKGLRLAGKLYLEQSHDGKAVMIKKIENSSYKIPYMKSNLSGVVGGGNVDAIVNALIEEVIIDYVNRFHGIIAAFTSKASVVFSNNVLHRFDTWCYIDALQAKIK